MSHPGANGANLHTHTTNGGLNSGLQDPGLHSTSQDPESSSHLPRTGPAQPYYYFHAPPPPPILQYQWPMSLLLNPFEGVPGMGYGVVMPPFHSSIYMETPRYMVPHPHFLTVDYMRLLHPHVHSPSASYQNPSQSRRRHLTRTVSGTVNSEVQTEPIQRDINYFDRPLVDLDSGNGTASNSPSSSDSSQKPDSAEADNFDSMNQQVGTSTSSNARDFQENLTCTNNVVRASFNVLPPMETKTESLIRATLAAEKSHKDGSSCRNAHSNIWSVSSSDSMGPVCSSSKEDEVVKERSASISNLQMNWRCGTPQATVLEIRDQVLPSETPLEQEKVSDCGGDNYNNAGMLQSDLEDTVTVLKLPVALNELLSEPQGITEIIPYDMSLKYCQIKEKMNESVWSVESLPLFVPTTEWLLQNGMSEPEVIIEIMEEAKNESSQPELQNPNQESLPVHKEQEKSPCSSEKEATHLNSPAMENMLPTGHIQNVVDVETKDDSCGQLCVPVTDQRISEVSLSKGRLVDCGIQCNKLQELKCLCEAMKSSTGPSRRQSFTFSEMNKVNGVSADRSCMNRHMQKRRSGQWRNRCSEKHSSQQNPYSGHSGKLKGGNERNQQY